LQHELHVYTPATEWIRIGRTGEDKVRRAKSPRGLAVLSLSKTTAFELSFSGSPYIGLKTQGRTIIGTSFWLNIHL